MLRISIQIGFRELQKHENNVKQWEQKNRVEENKPSFGAWGKGFKAAQGLRGRQVLREEAWLFH